MKPLTEIHLRNPALQFAGNGSIGVGLVIEKQQQTNWCWAAVTVSISKYYSEQSKWTQCLLACAERNDKTCCERGDSRNCNAMHDIDKALKRTKNLARMINGKISEKEIEAALKGKVPVIVRLEFSNGKGHFIAITAIRRNLDGTMILLISDPIYGEAVVTPRELNGTYQLSGVWTHTYITRAE